MNRLPNNTNLTLHEEPTWNGMRVNLGRGPLIREYLQGIDDALWAATDDHTRVSVIRVDLHFPMHREVNSKGAISRFTESFKAKIRQDIKRRVRRRKGGRVHRCTPRIIWVREWNEGALNPHYHLAILLNYHEYWRMGQYEPGSQSVAAMISEAWSSALRLSPDAGAGLVHFCDNTLTLLDLNSSSFSSDYDKVFSRLSYFAKLRSKRFGDGVRNFGSCRTPGRASKEWRDGKCLLPASIA